MLRAAAPSDSQTSAWVSLYVSVGSGHLGWINILGLLGIRSWDRSGVIPSLEGCLGLSVDHLTGIERLERNCRPHLGPL